MKTYDFDIVSIDDLILHDLTNEHPLMDDSEYMRLLTDINKLGQIEPVTVYKKQIVDGRHRYNALRELGETEIKIKTIPDSLSIDEVKELVLSTEIRRHQTPTQKGIKAWLTKEKEGLTQEEAISKYMTNKRALTACSKISKTRHQSLLNDLYLGKTVAVGSKTTDTLNGLVKLIQEEESSLLNSKILRDSPLDNNKEIAKTYLNNLRGEDPQVIKLVANGAYALIK